VFARDRVPVRGLEAGACKWGGLSGFDQPGRKAQRGAGREAAFEKQTAVKWDWAAHKKVGCCSDQKRD